MSTHIHKNRDVSLFIQKHIYICIYTYEYTYIYQNVYIHIVYCAYLRVREQRTGLVCRAGPGVCGAKWL